MFHCDLRYKFELSLKHTTRKVSLTIDPLTNLLGFGIEDSVLATLHEKTTTM